MEDKTKNNHSNHLFTKESIAQSLRIWECSSLSICDIRYNHITPVNEISNYPLPSSAFIYTKGIKGEIYLNEQSYQTERFNLFHASKGSHLSMFSRGNTLEYYMICYKSATSSFHIRERERLLKQVNPFLQQYALIPQNPIFLLELLQRMYEVWNNPTPLERFYEKTSFYQFLYEVYKELDHGEINVLQQDIAALVKRYLTENYRENISIQKLAATFYVSLSHLSRTFKQRYGYSPQEYLKNIRMHAAHEYLLKEQMTLKEIATQVGFADEYHFSRMFKKEYGIAPDLLRQKSSSDKSNYSIGTIVPFQYNEESQVSLNKLIKGGNNMFQIRKNKIVVAAALSLMLLSACGSNTVSSTSEQAVTKEAQQVEATQAVQGKTKIVNTVMGDIEIPANPSKVACYTWTGDLLSLGIVPVVSNDVELGPTKELLKGTAQSWFKEPEEIMALEPDLIIVREKEQYETFNKIAPCIVVPYDSSLEERMTLFGEIFDKQEEAKAAVDAFNNKVETYKEDFKAAGIYGKSIAIARYIGDNSLWLYGEDFGFGGSILYGMLGFTIPEKIRTDVGDEGFKQISWEALPSYLDADYIELTVEDGSSIDDLNNNEIWTSLDAVKERRIIDYSYDYDRKSLYVMDKVLDFYHEQFLKEQNK